MNTTGTIISPLDTPPAADIGKPFFEETLTLLRSVRDHDFDTLAALCDDDFGIVDGDPSGTISIIRTREEWEQWFHTMFATLSAMGAGTDSEITRYDALATEQMGFSALEFRQFLHVGADTATFDCVATIVWKQTSDGWREARWHVSVITADIPASMRPDA
jgi:ketosteroid isomerase-like protein